MNMSNREQMEQEALNLPARERERLVLAMWDSLDGVSDVDPEGISIAVARDTEIESGMAQAIGHAEFRRRTSNRE